MTQPQPQPVVAQPQVQLVVTIGTDQVQLSLLTAFQSWRLQSRLAPIMADVAQLYALFVDGARQLVDQPAAAQDLDALALLPLVLPLVDQAAPVIARLCGKLPGQELEALVRDLLVGATINGAPLFAQVAGAGDAFNLVMRGRTIDTWRLLVHAIRVNYPDFFGLLGARASAKGQASRSTASST